MILVPLIQAASSLPTNALALESSISVLESEIKTLENSSVPWENSLPWLAGLVAVGVAMEFWVIWREHRDDMEAWKRGTIRSPERPSISKYVIEIASLILIVSGIVGELAIGIKITSINGQLRTKNAELRSKSDQLVALINDRAEGLEREASGLRQRNLELEALIQPRDLSPAQSKAIAGALMKFRGKMVSILAMNDPETMRFGEIISNALRGGKPGMLLGSGPLNVENSVLMEGLTTPLRTGVEVAGTNEQLVEALSDALFSIGHIEQTPKTPTRILVGGFTFKPDFPVPPEATVYVGLKPIRFLAKH